jgi:hypothetical protein
VLTSNLMTGARQKLENGQKNMQISHDFASAPRSLRCCLWVSTAIGSGRTAPSVGGCTQQQRTNGAWICSQPFTMGHGSNLPPVR